MYKKQKCTRKLVDTGMAELEVGICSVEEKFGREVDDAVA